MHNMQINFRKICLYLQCVTKNCQANHRKPEQEMEEPKVEIYSADLSSELNITFTETGIHAGFPSPAADYHKDAIDLNKELIHHPSSTFYARVKGDSMKDRGIDDGDLLIVDKSIEPSDGNVVVAFIDGEFALKVIHIPDDRSCLWLMPANEKYQPIKVTQENDFMIWGVVTFNIKQQL